MDDTVRVDYRKPTEADIDAIADAINQSKEGTRFYQNITAENVGNRMFKDSNFNQSDYWLAVSGREIVGFCEGRVYKSHAGAGKNTGFVNLEVLPEYRGNNIERELMRQSLDCLKSKNIKSVKFTVSDETSWKHKVASEFGFKDINHSYDAVFKFDVMPAAYAPPDGIEFEHTTFREMDKELFAHIAKVFNKTYSEHFTYIPTAAAFVSSSADVDKRDTKITLAKKDSKIIGICAFGDTHDSKVGVAMGLGVSEAYRKKGIGRSLLYNVIESMWNRGIRTIRFNVDVKNDKAIKIYRDSFGFIIQSENVLYQLDF